MSDEPDADDDFGDFRPPRDVITPVAVVLIVAGGLAWSGYILTAPLPGDTIDESWPRVPCTVIEASVGKEAHDRGRRSNLRNEFLPAVRCRYVVDGEKYDRLADGFRSSHERADARAELSAFPIGLETVCLVSPFNPAEFRLRDMPPSSMKQAQRGIALAVLLLAFAVAWKVYLRLRTRRRDDDDD